jgi:hypothetical protein
VTGQEQFKLSESKEKFRNTFQGNTNTNNKRSFKDIKRSEPFSKHLSGSIGPGEIIDFKGPKRKNKWKGEQL